MLNIIVTLLDLKCLLEILCLVDSFVVLISFQNNTAKHFSIFLKCTYQHLHKMQRILFIQENLVIKNMVLIVSESTLNADKEKTTFSAFCGVKPS